MDDGDGGRAASGSTPAHLLVGAATTVVVGLLAGGEWPHFVIGALLALALWVMLLAGRSHRGRVDPLVHAAAAAVGTGLGYVITRVGGGEENAVWWAVGFILAGVLIPSSGIRGRSERGSPDA